MASSFAPGKITFKTESEVRDQNIELGEIANVESPELAALVLDSSPNIGKTVLWTAAELSKKLHPYQEALKELQLKLPALIKITRLDAAFSQAALEEKIKSALTNVIPKNWETKVTNLQKVNWPEVSASATWSVAPLNQRPKGPTQFEILVEDSNKSTKRIWVNGFIEFFSDVSVAQSSVAARTKMSDAEIKLEKRNVTYLSELPASEQEIATSLAKFNISAGSILTKSLLDRELAVKFGEEVELRIGTDTFSVSSKGIVQQNAHIGDTVRVRTSNSLKTVNGVVTAKGLVKVNL